MRLLLALVLLLGGTLMLPAEDQPTVIRFGISSVGVGGKPFVGSHVIGLAHAKGSLDAEFKADGITIDWLFHKGAGPAVNEGVAAGRIDVAWQGDLPSLIGRSAGLPTRLLMAANRGGNSYLSVPTNSPAKSLRDLIGKRVVMFKGTASQLLVDRLLAQNGLSERDFRMVTLDSSASLTALANGDVDAVWGTLLHFDLRDRGITRVVFGTQDPVPSGGQPWATSQSGLIATESFITKCPRILQRIVDVLVREAAWAADPANHSALYDYWAKSGTPATHFREEYEKATPRVRLSPLLDETFVADYRLGVKQAVDFRLIRTPINLDAWIDRRFLDQALAKLPQPHPWATPVP